LGYISVADSIGLSLTIFMQLTSKSTEFGKITQNNDHYTLFEVIQSDPFGTNRKPMCDFLLMINTILHPISHRFQVIAAYWSNIRF